MDKLPAELLDNICFFMDRSALAQFRAVSKDCDQAAVRHLFENISSYTSKSRIDALQNISQHPHLAECVRMLEHSSFTLKHPDEISSLPSTIQGLPNRQIVRKYAAWYREIQAMQKTSTEYNTLLAFCKACKNLKELHLFCDSILPDVINRDHYRIFGVEEVSFDWTERHSSASLTALLECMKQSTVKLTQLSLYCIDWQFFTGSDSRDPVALFRQEALQDVETFTLSIYNCPVTVDGRVEYLGNSNSASDIVGRCLASMRKLRQVSITPESMPAAVEIALLEEPMKKLPLTRIFLPSTTFDHLQRLYLYDIKCTGKELMSVILRHKKTLYGLELQDVLLLEASWIDIVKEIRVKICLTEVNLFGLLRDVQHDLISNAPTKRWWWLGYSADGGNKLATSVEAYIKKKGESYQAGQECPLTTENCRYEGGEI